MKKILIFATLVATMISCSTPKTVVQSKKVIKGNWTLDDISYSEAGTFTVKLLNDTSRECFEGSTWRFIPNNNSGVYSINNGDCPTGDRNFIFTIQEVDKESGLFDFLLKPTDAKHKSADGKGFRLKLARLSDSSMRWEQTVSLEGKPFTISMNFSKTIE